MKAYPFSMIGAASAAMLALGGQAAAQETVVEGVGYEISEGTVLHPRVSAETGMISNVFYTESDPKAAPVLRLQGSFSLASEHNRPPGERSGTVIEARDDEGEEEEVVRPTWDFRLSARLGYEQYLSTDDQVGDQSNVTAGFIGNATFNPEGQVSVWGDDIFDRDTRPRNFESTGDLNRVINRLRVGARWRPANYSMQFGGSYENYLDRFDSNRSDFANRMNHTVRGRAEWQFLPITRFFFDTSYGFFGPLGDSAVKRTSNPLRIQLGGATAITELFTIRAHIGYGKGFYSQGEDFNNVLYGTELGFRYSPVGRFTVTYEYGFEDSLNANFYRDHALAGRVDHQISTILFTGGLEARLRGYRGIDMSIGPASRDDVILRLYAVGHYLYRDWLAFSGNFNFVSDQTNYVDNLGDDPSFTRFELTAGATAAF